MFLRLRLTKHRNLWQWVHILSAVFVFSYIAFDVLDLDLSDFPLKHPAREKAAAITATVKPTELLTTTKSEAFRIESSLLRSSAFKELVRIQQKDMSRTSRLRKSRLTFRPPIVPQPTSDSPVA
jgi:hypothetical protein